MLSFLRANLPWILLSLILSVGLWGIVTVEVDPIVTSTIGNIPIEVQGAPKSVLVQPSVLAVEVTVSAPTDAWPQLNVSKFRADLDASKVVPGAQDIPVTVVSLDPRARVESWNPDKVSLRVDPLRTKVVPVQVLLQGVVPDLSPVRGGQDDPDRGDGQWAPEQRRPGNRGVHRSQSRRGHLDDRQVVPSPSGKRRWRAG